MLEEALRDEKGRTANPSETALAMLNFLQYDLSGGGAAAEARFYNNLFGPLCERVVGPMDENYRHSSGTGWLAAQVRWARPATTTMPQSMLAHSPLRSPPAASSRPSSSQLAAPSASSSASWDTDPVVRLLSPPGLGSGGGSDLRLASSSSTRAKTQQQQSPLLRGSDGSFPTLVEIISGESENRPAAGFSYPFGALPKAVQEAWMAVLELSLLPSPRTASVTGGAPSGFWSEDELPGGAGGAVGAGGIVASKHKQQRQQILLMGITDNDLRLFGSLLFKSPPSREQPGLARWRQVTLAQKEAAVASHAYYQHYGQQPQDSFRQTTASAGLPSRGVTIGGGSGALLFRPSSQNLGLTPLSAASILTSPTTAGAGTNAKEQHHHHQRGDENSIGSVDVILSILEYYLLAFIRFPTALGSTTKPLIGATSSSVPFGEMVYNYLFARYLSYFLPYAPAGDTVGGGHDRAGGKGGRHICFMNGSDASSSPGNAQSELFVRLIICLWLEAPVRAAPTSSAVEALVEQLQQRRNRIRASDTRGGTGMDPHRLEYSLDRAYDLAQTQSALATTSSSSQQALLSPPPSHIKSCLRKLLAHLLSDPSLRVVVQNFGRRDREGGTGPQQQVLLLPDHALWAIQPSLYNYVRLMLRSAPIHAADSAFFSALDLWLIWLEPWNLCRTKSRYILTVPRYSEASKYDPVWEPYVAANLHLYLTPLAIFLRRSRELDFSPRKFESSMRIVRRVFRVYTPPVVQALRGGCTRRYPALVQRHVEHLGKFAPPMPLDPDASSLLSCQGDMQSLLEEVHMQHLKKVRELDFVDRMGAWIEGLFGMGIIQGEEKELNDLVSRARGIVGFPATYQVFPNGVGGMGTEAAATGSRPASRAPTRTPDGQLTQQGRDQLALGEIKCKAGDVAYVGDLMYGLVRPHEVALLVKLLVLASDSLNEKLGWDATTMFRINLRFLADYRILMFTLFTLYLAYKCYF